MARLSFITLTTVGTTLAADGPSQAVEGQPFNVTGLLTRNDTGGGIPNAIVELYVNGVYQTYTTTDSLGWCGFEVIINVPGAYTLVLKYLGGECGTTCELSCQDTCQVSCKTTCETYCQTACEGECQEACEVSCQATCEEYCEFFCQTTCQVSCKTNCELYGCETTCEMTGCELTCQTDIEIS